MDGYAGAMKGVIKSINPKADIIDISHHIRPQDILHAGFVLATSTQYYPKGTIHVAVVDPEVGSARHAIAVSYKDQIYIGPNNGLFQFCTPEIDKRKIYVLENRKYFLSKLSSTFHGRDLFASVAAHISLGIPLEELGPQLDTLKAPTGVPLKSIDDHLIRGSITHIDSFGNIITNITEFDLHHVEPHDIKLKLHQYHLQGIKRTYCDVQKGEALICIGSSGYLEIAVREGNAAEMMEAHLHDAVTIKLDDI